MADIEALEPVRSVTRIDSGPDTRLDIGVDDASQAVGAVIGELDRHGAAVSDVSMTEPDLETVFLRLTGKALRN